MKRSTTIRAVSTDPHLPIPALREDCARRGKSLYVSLPKPNRSGTSSQLPPSIYTFLCWSTVEKRNRHEYALKIASAREDVGNRQQLLHQVEQCHQYPHPPSPGRRIPCIGLSARLTHCDMPIMGSGYKNAVPPSTSGSSPQLSRSAFEDSRPF